MRPIHLLAAQRPRERILRSGAESLSVAELVAIILGSSTGGVHVLAERVAVILKSQESGAAALLAQTGLGPAKTASLLAALALASRVERERNESAHLGRPEDIVRHCQDLIEKPQEWFVAFFLSSRSALIQRQVITVGTATASLVHPREVFRAAIQANAVAVAVAHNHPSGSVEPSPADLDVTARLAQAGECIGIPLVDHVICSRQGFSSLKMARPDLFCYARDICTS